MPKCAEFAPARAGIARGAGRHLLESESTGESGGSVSGGIESRSGKRFVNVQAGGSEPGALKTRGDGDFTEPGFAAISGLPRRALPERAGRSTAGPGKRGDRRFQG